MNTLKKIGNAIMSFLGVVFPCIIFLALFMSFVLTIIYRYFFHISLTWGNEVAVIAYIWIMFFGCGKAIENDEHVVFSLVYDKCSAKMQLIMKVVYNILLAALLCAALPACIQKLQASTQITGVLKLSYKLVFGPFIWMFVESIVRSLINVKKAFVEYKGKSTTTEEEAA